MKIIVIDNYDSFTYNLVHALKSVSDAEIRVVRNDQFQLEELEQYDKILLSPGPGIPSEAGLMPAVIEMYKASKPILGICLGHQAISECFGAKLENMATVLHGIASDIDVVVDDILFQGIPSTFQAGHYHSWLVSDENFPSCIEVTSRDGEGRIMSIRHKEYDLRGMQFHPESVLTPEGEQILKNWVEQ